MTTSTSAASHPTVELDTDTGFSVGHVLWQRGPGQYRVSVACNVTFELRKAHSPVASAHRPLEKADRFVDDDPRRVLCAPADLVPRKGKAEVIVVGSAYSADETEKLDAKLSVASLKKSLTVHGWRAMTAEGVHTSAAPFKRMALSYEHAKASDLNPVGMRADAKDEYGRFRLPTIEAREGGTPGLDGFGPVAAHWPSRQKLLQGPSPDLFLLAQQPLPGDFNFAFFNAAPPDQWLPALSPTSSLSLEHLHPQHRRILTHLEEVRPFMSTKGKRGMRMPMKPDTLLIDTDAGTATLTFRAIHPITSPQEATQLFVGREAVTEKDRESGGAMQPSATATMDIEVLAQKLGKSKPLPFEHGKGGPRRGSDSNPGRNLPFQAKLDPLASTSAGGWQTAPSTPGRPAPAPPVPPSPTGPPVPASPTGPPVPARQPAPPPVPTRGPRPPNPAAGPSPWMKPATSSGPAHPAAPPQVAPTQVKAPAVVDAPMAANERPALALLWLEPEVSIRLRRNEAFKKIIDDFEKKAVDFALDDGLDPEASVEDHRETFEVLVEGATSDGTAARTALTEATRESGKFVPELRLLEADLSTPFDDKDQLRAAMAIAASLVPEPVPDEEPGALARAVEQARTFLERGDELVPPSIVRAHREKIEEAFEDHRTTLPGNYLQSESEAVLLAHRKYQRRIVFGDEHLLTMLHLAQCDEPVPCYLPGHLAKKLPLYRRFRVRLIAEVRRREDETEASPLALRPVALARVLPQA